MTTLAAGGERSMRPDSWHEVIDYFRALPERPTLAALGLAVSAAWAFLAHNASDVFLVGMFIGLGAGFLDTLLGVAAATLVPEQTFDRRQFAKIIRKGIGYSAFVVLLMGIGMTMDVASAADKAPRWFYILPGGAAIGLFAVEGLSCLGHIRELVPTLGRMGMFRWARDRLRGMAQEEPPEGGE